MNRINKLFQTKKKDLLSIYFTAGFPKIDDTVNVIRELESAGVDMIEIGIPFSDPMADGIVIQNSSSVALENGMTLNRLFEQLTDIRKEVQLPLILMGYLNPIMRFGIENFCRRCSEVGVDGVIVPDLPFNEYIKDYKPVADKYGIQFIMLITPETSEERVRLIDENTDSFIYMVSTAATTGVQQAFGSGTIDYFVRMAAMPLRNPRLIGFGISNRETLQAAFEHANGAIIGSAFVKLLAQYPIREAVVKLMVAIGRK